MAAYIVTSDLEGILVVYQDKSLEAEFRKRLMECSLEALEQFVRAHEERLTDRQLQAFQIVISDKEQLKLDHALEKVLSQDRALDAIQRDTEVHLQGVQSRLDVAQQMQQQTVAAHAENAAGFGALREGLSAIEKDQDDIRRALANSEDEQKVRERDLEELRKQREKSSAAIAAGAKAPSAIVQEAGSGCDRLKALAAKVAEYGKVIGISVGAIVVATCIGAGAGLISKKPEAGGALFGLAIGVSVVIICCKRKRSQPEPPPPPAPARSAIADALANVVVDGAEQMVRDRIGI